MRNPAPDSSAPVAAGSPSKVVEARFLYPFLLVTSLFALWGFANDVTNPLVRAFREIFVISNAQSSLVQWAFYGGYATMAIPAALAIRKVSYKFGIMVGLALFAAGALLTVPASRLMSFNVFLVGFYVLTFGLAFLETSANPYILSMGAPETATRRLNLAQAFNPIGSLLGMATASLFILPSLQVSQFREAQLEANPEYAEMLPSEIDARIGATLEEFAATQVEAHREMQAHDLNVVMVPYAAIALLALALLVVFAVSKMPDTRSEAKRISLLPLLKRLRSFRYLGGVAAQAFYVGAQIMCWTFVIHYGMTLIGLSAAQAQNWNILAMTIFLSGRFGCAFLLKYFNAGRLLAAFAVAAGALTLGAVFLRGMPGLYCLVGVSAFMSLMFPTIYGIALQGLTPEDAKLGSAGLIFAIVGGAVMPRLQGAMIDAEGWTLGPVALESVRASFFLPAVCFAVVALYGFLVGRGERGA